MPKYDIAIAGAGPAGLACALALHRQGHKVTLFEQFEAAKPLGSGIILQPTGLGVLDWLGLGQRMRALGARIDKLSGTAHGRIVLDVRYAALGAARGYAVHRAGLFNVLHDAVVKAGIAVQTGHRIVEGAGGTLRFSNGRKEGPFDLIIDASGSRSPLLNLAAVADVRKPLAYGAIWASLPWPGAPFDDAALAQRYRAANVMCGVLPIGKCHEQDQAQTAFFWSLKHADFQGWQDHGVDAWKQDVRALWPETEALLASITAPEQMTLARYDHHTLPVPYGARIAFVGDSAHSTSPQLGQGANMALLDCMALAEALEKSPSIQEALHIYAQARGFHVRLYQAMSRVFTPFYQSDSLVLPLVRDYLAATLSRLPPAQRLLARLVAGQLGLR